MSDPLPGRPAQAPYPTANGPRRDRSALERFLGGPPLWVALRLLMLSLVVGVILAAIGLDPFDIVASIGDLIRWVAFRIEDIVRLGWDAVHWLVRYVLLGAAVVIPIWLVVRLAKAGGR